MKKWNRRELLEKSLAGLTATAAFTLIPRIPLARGEKLAPPSGATPSDSLGPYYKKGAPFRGYLAPEGAAGVPMLIQGRVYGADTRKALDGATIDVWQADAKGRYHGMDEEENFLYRARMRTTQGGFYRFRTIRPGHYGFALWGRPAHIHYYVRHSDYRPLVTQLYFEGDPRLGARERARPSLIAAVRKIQLEKTYEAARFDIVLAPR